MYVDESGTPGSLEMDYFVLAGIAVFERSMLGLSRALDSIQERYLPHETSTIEFHASEIRSPRKDTYWRKNNIPKDILEQILQDIGGAIGNPNFLTWVKLFGVAIQQKQFGFDGTKIYERALSELCMRFDTFLTNESVRTNQQQYGMLIFDESHLQTETRNLMKMYRLNQHEFVTTGRIAEVPFFATSKESRLLQAADYVAYALFRFYKYKDGSCFDQVIQAFHQDNSVIHGLKHIHDSFNTCYCPACFSRRVGR